MKNNNFALVSDFDGTISKKDFFSYAQENILSEQDMLPWEDYKGRKISHVEALHRIFSKIRIPENKLIELISTIEVDESFLTVVDYCLVKDIKVFVVSAGADFYINHVLKRFSLLDKVELITNRSSYSQEEGLCLFPFGESHPLYDSDLGVSKKKFVQNLQSKGNKVIFAGDGRPDIEAASVADVVFAKDYLINLCEKNDICYNFLGSFDDILLFLKNSE